MSFEKMQDIDNKSVHPRTCILLYGFTPQELKSLKNIARLTGLCDQILADRAYTLTPLSDLLDGKDLVEGDLSLTPLSKTILFNNVPSNRINAFIEGLKKFRVARPLMATVTPTSLHWTLQELIANLVAERSAFAANQTVEH